MRAQRLYLRLYFAFLGVLLAIVLVIGGIVWMTGRPFFARGRGGPRLAVHIARMLPPPGDPLALARAMEEIHEELGIDVMLVGPAGEMFAGTGNPIELPDPGVLQRLRGGGADWIGHGLVAAPLRGGAVLVARLPLPPGAVRQAVLRAALLLLGVLAVSLALVYPLSRSITRPVEKLTAVVEAYGRGDLSQRSGLGGLQDEVGRLARSFDEMADRIQAARKAERELLANVSHELRTPLARIKVAMELIDAPDAALRRRLAAVGEEVDELDRLIADVLTASRLDLASLPLRKVRIDVPALIARGRERAQALDPELRIEQRVEPGLAVDADEALLSRAVDNLLDNARKYGNGGGVSVEARRDGAHAVIAVRDHGPGIPEAELEHVFDPFFRGEGARGRSTGFGLGLSLARRVAEAHGGSASAGNAEGGGARIELRLPTVSDADRAG
ncbi:MAG TPA: HAMP domain-containing sensor histidine kinase [Myxococcales bacterium]|nr:HAMP domain-containing sensor histidine kinase [Myxococcales bacterium]